MATHTFKKIAFYYRSDSLLGPFWKKRIQGWIRRRYPKTVILETSAPPKTRRDAPNLLIVLGGDGTILEAAQKFQKWNPMIFGLNLGHVGFLASVREQKYFLSGLEKVLRRKYRAIPRMLIRADLFRRCRKIFSAYALNDIAIQHLLGIVDVGVYVDGHPVQYIHGSGVIVATATGSTAYNLSAHGPIVMPDIKCFIITELLDHDIPSPSIVVKYNNTINIRVLSYRETGIISLSKTNKKIDVIL